jgi:2-haloacid dehalogenase
MQAARERPEAVVFDLGNVLIRWDRRLLYATVFEDPVELDRFLAEVYTLDANERLDRGQPLAEFCAVLAAEHPRYAAEINVLEERWIETLGPAIPGTVEILRELRAQGVACFALSNWNADTYALTEGVHEFLGWFDGVVLSGREGVTKPDPEIFRRLLDGYGLAPGAVFFTDDAPANVDAARRLGIDAEVFVGPDELRASLQARGLLR